MLSHLVVFEDLIRQLKLADAELAETHLIMTLFVTLPESYDPFITLIEKRDRQQDTTEKSTALAGQKGKPKQKSFSGKCHKCGRKGHMKKDCRHKGSGDANVAAESRAVSFMVNCEESHQHRSKKLIFKLDSGSSDHLVNETGFFLSLSRLSKPINIEVAKDGESLVAKTKGVINGRSNKGVQVNVNG